MAKNSYNIPYPLDATYLDMEIAIQSNQGLGIRPYPIKHILLAMGGIVSCFFLETKTFIADGTVAQRVIFAFLYAVLCLLLLTSNRQKQLGIEKIQSVLTFLQPDNRFVSTRANDNPNNIVKICGFDDITDEGMIKYCDGSLGLVFDIIGNASVLLFNDHKNAIIDRVDNHYRKMRPNVSYQFVTRKESQNVYLQVESLAEREREMTVYDSDLAAMFETDRYILAALVGQSFKSLHQYLIIQAPNQEELNLALNVFYSEIENSELMFKYAEQLDKNEVIAFMTDIYGTRKEY